jgi:glycosyltransferase involved in cell wall biosynthesis
LCPVGERGGAEAIMLDFLKRHDRARFTIEAAFLTDGPLVADARALGVRATVLPIGRVRRVLRTGAAMVRIARIIQTSDIECVLCQMPLSQMIAAVPARVLGCKSVLMLFGRLNGSLVDRIAVRLPVDGILSCALDITRHASATLPRRRRSRIATYRMGIDISAYDPAIDGSRFRAELGVAPGSPLVATVARFEPPKGQRYFIEAARMVLETHPAARFVLIGSTQFGADGSYEAELRGRVRELGLSDRILFAGLREDLPSCLAAVDIVVHGPVNDQPGGLIVLNAMSMAKPVIATDGGDRHEWMEPEHTGFLIPPADARSMAAAITRLIDDPPLMRRVGLQARERAEREFSTDRMVRELEGRLLDLVAPSASGLA